MFQIDNKNFGTFLITLRKEKGLTQKELAQKLFISDKAVSKWERGLSMPDIALLLPLSAILGVTTTELLNGNRIEQNDELNIQQVETWVTQTIKLSEEETQRYHKNRLSSRILFLSCSAIVFLELMLLYNLGYTAEMLHDNLFTVELLMFIFGGWFIFFAKDTLPIYYDENNISTFSDGFFRMNIPGVHFNNSNWPHIVRAGQISTMILFTAYPILYFTISSYAPTLWQKGSVFLPLVSVFSIFIPFYIIGKRYE